MPGWRRRPFARRKVYPRVRGSRAPTALGPGRVARLVALSERPNSLSRYPRPPPPALKMFPSLAPCFHFSNEPSARLMPIGRDPKRHVGKKRASR
jgi:hypothetical protein